MRRDSLAAVAHTAAALLSVGLTKLSPRAQLSFEEFGALFGRKHAEGGLLIKSHDVQEVKQMVRVL